MNTYVTPVLLTLGALLLVIFMVGCTAAVTRISIADSCVLQGSIVIDGVVFDCAKRGAVK